MAISMGQRFRAPPPSRFLPSRLFADPAFWLLLGCAGFLLLWPELGETHERWILTPSQILEWNAKPKPGLFSHWSTVNVTMISGFALFTAGWIWLGFTGARELFPDLQARLAALGDYVPPVLRFCMAWVLISSAIGLEPRYGVERFSSPTLFAPDLELSLLGPMGAGLQWLELALGLGLLFGIYVRLQAVGLLVLILLATLLFQADMLAYLGALLGVAIYLLLQGPGNFYIPLPTHPALLDWQAQLAEIPRQRAQAIMRVLTGVNIFYLGVLYKVFQPNLVLGIISIYDVPLFSAAPEGFTMLMMLVEVVAGILIVAGILLRPLSLFFLFAFLFFAALLPESWMAHALYYGVMISFLFNGAGHWHMPEAQDKSAHIVVIGGTVAAIHAAMKVEKLVGQYSNVRLTLVHDDPNILFYPLLPEVIGGTMQPGNAVNPIRRVLPQTHVIQGSLSQVEASAKRVRLRLRNEQTLTIDYDQLVLALFPIPKLTGIPGLMTHASPINSIGDALQIRKNIIDRVEEAEASSSPADIERLLTFAVIGSGQRACASAVEICEMLNAAEPSYRVLKQHGWKVHLYEDTKIPYSRFEEEIQAKRDRELQKAGVTLCPGREVVALTPQELVFADGQRQVVGFTVNASFTLPRVQVDDRVFTWPFELDDQLRFTQNANIWVTAMQDQDRARRFLTTADWVDLGKAAGANAWAASQGYETKTYRPKKRWFQPYNMGRRSICRIGGFVFGGFPAWLASRVSHLAAFPGLERNLRVLLDWFLDIPFRADIAILAPDPSSRLERIHLEAGDDVIREGETGDVAYVIESGRVEVLKKGKRVTELGVGECFGEIALIGGSTKRVATVRCLTACELTVLGKDDFQALTLGSGALAKAIRTQADDRLKALRKL